jgi:hypothetical protein
LKEEKTMKRLLGLAVVVALLGGCAVVPVGYPVHERAYHGYGYNDGYRWHAPGYGPHWRYGGYHR